MCPKGHAAAMSRIFSADATSLLKVLLHSAKHPSRSINGLLLGKVDGEGVSIIDAVPLFHTPTCLASPLETALRMVGKTHMWRMIMRLVYYSLALLVDFIHGGALENLG